MATPTTLTIADAARASWLSARPLRYYESAAVESVELIEWKINYYRERLEQR